MKRRIFQIICVLMLLVFGTVAVIADDVETEYIDSYDEALSFAGNMEGQAFVYSAIIGGGLQNGEYVTYVYGTGDLSDFMGEIYTFVLDGDNFKPGEAVTFVINGENVQGVLVQTEAEDMITVNCSSLIAPAVSTLLITGVLVAAWGLKKKREEQENP